MARSWPLLSVITICMLRDIAISSPSEFLTTLRLFTILTLPSYDASIFDEPATWAAPPIWKVRMVSWVPGSPIDWAAMTPTASPILTEVPRARSRP